MKLVPISLYLSLVNSIINYSLQDIDHKETNCNISDESFKEFFHFLMLKIFTEHAANKKFTILIPINLTRYKAP
jgi:hypothetical protein